MALMRLLLRLILGVALCASAVLSAAAGESSYNLAVHYTKQEVRIPMRDGVRLFTAIYAPKDVHQPYPFLITRTPYSIGQYGAGKFRNTPAGQFAQSGFIFVYQDVRGRFMSEGQFVEERPMLASDASPGRTDESTDTYDTIEWLLHNVPNNNGKVGVRGTSYPGFFTSTAMIRAHPALLAVSPQAPMTDLYHGDDAYHNGALLLLSNFSFYTDFGPQHNPEPGSKQAPFAWGTDDSYQYFLKLGSLANAKLNDYWADVKNHWTYDDYWKARNLLPHFENIRPAVLLVGGWFDAEDLAGPLKSYAAIKSQSPQTDLHLVMGPWSHGAWDGRSPDELGDVKFGTHTPEFFRDQIELPFFLHYLKGGEDPKLPAAYVFETGGNQWHRESVWPPPAETRNLYLQPDKQLSFDPPAQGPEYDQYTSDPAHPVPFFAKPVLDTPKAYMVADQRFVATRPDVLVYQTATLSSDLTIAGPVTPSLYISTSGTDSDYVVKLIDVWENGYQQLLRGEPFRGKFRNSDEKPEPLTPGKITPIRFEMPDVYHRFQKGHRLMVQVQSSWFPLIDRNPQTFVTIPEAKPADFVPATERVYHSSPMLRPSNFECCPRDSYANIEAWH